MKSHSNS